MLRCAWPHRRYTPPDRTAPAFETWTKIDAIVLQWIYETLSDDLLVRVLQTKSTAHEALNRIANIFLNNKGSRAAALEHKFTNLSLRAMPSLDAYCQKLKELAYQLFDVDNPVTEQHLVLQLVRGLPPEFDTAASFINQSIPSWDTTCSMLQHRNHPWRSLLQPPMNHLIVNHPLLTAAMTLRQTAGTAPRPDAKAPLALAATLAPTLALTVVPLDAIRGQTTHLGPPPPNGMPHTGLGRYLHAHTQPNLLGPPLGLLDLLLPCDPLQLPSPRPKLMWLTTMPSSLLISETPFKQ